MNILVNNSELGDEVTVKVAAVKPEESAIDFEIVGMKKSFHRTRRETPKVIHAKKNKDGSEKQNQVIQKVIRKVGTDK